MVNGPQGAALVRPKRRSRFEPGRHKTTQRRQDGGARKHRWRKLCLAGQALAELVHQTQSILSALVGQMQIDHGRGDLLVTEELLNGVEMRAGFQQVGGEAVAQRLPIILMKVPPERLSIGTIRFSGRK
jgi:hypothetical protein